MTGDPAAPPGGLVDLDAALAGSHVREIVDELERDLVGLAPVKARVREVAALLFVSRLRESRGLAAGRPTLHMSFTGPPGTGKTTVALRMARMLHALGYVRKGHVVVVSREDLVGSYVGHTGPKTREALKKALGGVLFVDEAYTLYRPENERDYGLEAIEILLAGMEAQRDDLVVILAGYRDRMAAFFESNPGLRSRVAHHVDFPDYSIEELMAIADRMLAARQYAFDDGSRTAFRDYLVLRTGQPHFANARSVRNALDRVVLRQASRLMARGGVVPEEELRRIDEDDVRRSRVFSGGIDGSEDAAKEGP